MFIEKKKLKKEKKNKINENLDRNLQDLTKFEDNTKYLDKTINENNERSIQHNNSVYKY
jgi:hypothetical protein